MYGRDRIFYMEKEICNNFKGVKGDQTKLTCPLTKKKRGSGPTKDGTVGSEETNEYLQSTPVTNVIKTPGNVDRLALELKYFDDVRIK